MRGIVSAVGVALLVTAAQVSAQDTTAGRRGFVVSAGVGGASARFKCDGCTATRETGLSGFVGVGVQPVPALQLGWEIHGFTYSNDDTHDSFALLMGYGQWFPAPASGVFLKGSVGFGRINSTVQSPQFGELKFETNGFAAGLGTGYDFTLDRYAVLSPFVNYLHRFGASATVNGQTVDGSLGGNLLQLGMRLGFNWR